MTPAIVAPKIEAYVRTIRNADKRQYARDYMDYVLANPVTWLVSRGPAYECSYMAAQAVRQTIDAIARKTL